MTPGNIVVDAPTPAKDGTPKTPSNGLTGGPAGAPGGVAPANKPLAKPNPKQTMRISPDVLEAAGKDGDELLGSLHTALTGLTQGEAEDRERKNGQNVVAQEKQRGWFMRLVIILRNPLVILLAVLSTISFATGDPKSGCVIAGMVVLSAALRFFQEARADAAAAKLKAMIHVTATVVRDGKARELPLRDLVPGDIIQLSAGDMIPGDVRVLSAKDLFVSQGTLTGESFPVEKFHEADPKPSSSPTDFKNTCFMGTSVQSGTATAVVVATGVRTYLGSMADSITAEAPPTAFDKGIGDLTQLMIKIMAVMVPLVFVINGFTKHDWKSAFFFGLAVAVGLTPQMLPMIVSVCLAKGAMAMSRKKVIVKRLNSIQNFGAMDLLCTDKTGTLTGDRVVLQRHCNIAGRETDEVLLDGYLISYFQTGLKNLLDKAILQSSDFHQQSLIEKFKKLDEIPFDFTRRMMSVLVQTPEGKAVLLTKGAPEETFNQCSHYELDGKVSPMDTSRMKALNGEYARLSADGFRVLAVAVKELPGKQSCSRDDERDLVLKGYVAFLDPPKPSVASAIQALHRHGVGVKILTGDNELISRKVCEDVGLPAESVLLGNDVEKMSDTDLADAAEKTTLFARLSPAHKQRIIRCLQAKGHVVGYMGDGINDAPDVAHRGHRHIGRHGDRYREGFRRPDPARKRPHCAGGGRHRGT
jgi:Mg2+-importing ATPase